MASSLRPRSSFGRVLRDRLLLVVGGLTPLSLAGGCGSSVFIETGDAGAGGAASSGSTSVGPTGSGAGEPGTTTSSTSHGAGGAGAGGGASSSSGSGGCAPSNSTGSGEGEQKIACFALPGDAGSCPAPEDAKPYFEFLECVSEVICGPTATRGADCCYVIYSIPCVGGRAFSVGGRARTARADGGAAGWSAGDRAPAIAGLDGATRAELARQWAEDGLLEHASVASFARFALELLSVGADADLVAEAHAAALDEVAHARLCFGLASAYAEAPIAPSALDVSGALGGPSDLATVAAAAAREGCIGETVASVAAAEQLARATDPAVRAVLARIADDEARHAELAWRFVAWALENGGAPVRRAVERAFASAPCAPHPSRRPLAADAAALAAHGRLDASATRDVIARAIADVVKPCAESLLGLRGLLRSPGEAVRLDQVVQVGASESDAAGRLAHVPAVLLEGLS
jgi:hypothetical protein